MQTWQSSGRLGTWEVIYFPFNKAGYLARYRKLDDIDKSEKN